MLQENEELDDAIESFRAVIRLRPDYSMPTIIWASRLSPNAIRMERSSLSTAHSSCSPIMRSLTITSEWRLFKRANAAAIAEYQKLIALVPESAEAHYNLGLALKYKDQFDEPVGELRKAIALQPSLQEAHYTLGVILLQQSKLGEAASAFALP